METRVHSLDRSIHKTNEMLAAIEAVYHWEERRNQSLAALRAVLHALRDRLPAEQVIAFGAQLPLLIRGIYYDGWRLAATPQKMNQEDFIHHVQQEFPYAIEGNIEDLIRTVINVIRSSTDPHEIDKIRQMMPDDVAALME